MIIDPIPKIKTTKSGHKVKLLLLRCDFCGKENLRNWVLYRKTGVYRCTSCSNKTRKNEHRKGVSPANKQIKCYVACLSCGKEKLKTKRALVVAPRTFCDARCQIQWQRSTTDFQRGKNNSAYKHGERVNGKIVGYGIDFTKKLRLAIKIRDGFNCRNCKKNFSGKLNRHLDVHHVDENKYNNSDSNLISLCKSCHTTLHWIQLKKQGKSWDFTS